MRLSKEERLGALAIAISVAAEIVAMQVVGVEAVETALMYIGGAVGILAALGIGLAAFMIDARDRRLGPELLPLD